MDHLFTVWAGKSGARSAVAVTSGSTLDIPIDMSLCERLEGVEYSTPGDAKIDLYGSYNGVDVDTNNVVAVVASTGAMSAGTFNHAPLDNMTAPFAIVRFTDLSAATNNIIAGVVVRETIGRHA